MIVNNQYLSKRKGLNTPSSKIPLLGDTLLQRCKSNDRKIRFLWVGEKLMPKMHLRQPEFPNKAYGAFSKNKETIRQSKETWDSRYIDQNELDNNCFQHHITYGDI